MLDKVCVADVIRTTLLQCGLRAGDEFNIQPSTQASVVSARGTNSKKVTLFDLRPDAMILVNDTYVVLGEDKMGEAQYIDAIDQVMEVWAPLWCDERFYKAEMEYTFAYTVCEGVVRIYVLTKRDFAPSSGNSCGIDVGVHGGGHSGSFHVPSKGKTVHYRQVVPEFDLNSSVTTARARCVKACILIGVLIWAQHEAGYFKQKTVVNKGGNDAFKRTVVFFYSRFVAKNVVFKHPSPLTSRYQQLKQMYRDLGISAENAVSVEKDSSGPSTRSVTQASKGKQDCPGLSHLPKVLVEKVTAAMYVVQVSPFGRAINPSDLHVNDVVVLMRHTLLALMYLHSKGVVHRDVRVANVIQHDGKYLLIDLEEMDYKNKVPTDA